MDPPSASRPPADTAVWRVVASGVIALAVAMGVGRFAFTPLLPLMLRDGMLTVPAGAEWAAGNYAGYLLGALTAACFAAAPLRGLRIALAGVAASTLAVGALESGAPALLGTVLRALAGVFSAWALICASGWCLPQLARRGVSPLGAWVYTGVGAGIALTGVLAWLGGSQPARWLWLELGLLATVGAGLVARLADTGAPSRDEAAAPRSAAPSGMWRRHAGLIFCYGAFGFGYIVPATFLPAMAREQTADPLVFGLTWPLFGLAAIASVAASARWLARWPRRRVWALAQTVMAAGTGVAVLSSRLPALAASAVLVGGTFMVATMAGLQLARELEPRSPTPLLAAMTVAFAVGQIAGPVLIRVLGSAAPGADALVVANATATALLAISASWLWRAPSTDRSFTR